MRLLTHVLCKPTHLIFHSFIATISYSLQTNFNSAMKVQAEGRLEQQQLRGEYLPGDLEVISLLAR